MASGDRPVVEAEYSLNDGNEDLRNVDGAGVSAEDLTLGFIERQLNLKSLADLVGCTGKIYRSPAQVHSLYPQAVGFRKFLDQGGVFRVRSVHCLEFFVTQPPIGRTLRKSLALAR